jgi:hypothetical protein
MSNIYEKIKASSALKANAALIQGAADSAKKFQSYSTDQDAPSQSPPPPPVETPEEKKDDTSVDEVVATDEETPKEDPKEKGGILKALFSGGGGAAVGKFASPVKATKDEIKKSMGKGFVNDEFGDVTETTTKTAAVKDDYDGSGGYASDEDWAKFLETDQGKAYTEKHTTGSEEKKYTVEPTESKVEETTPGTESNYNMSYKNALSARMSEGVQRRDAAQDLRQFNKDSKRYNKRGFLGLGKKGKNKINPATGEKFANATEYADFKAGKSGRRNQETGLLDADAEYQQKLNSRRGTDKEAVTTSKNVKDTYDETKHGKREDITYSDTKTATNTAEVTDNDKKKENKSAPVKFALKKKSGAMKNFKYKK